MIKVNIIINKLVTFYSYFNDKKTFSQNCPTMFWGKSGSFLMWIRYTSNRTIFKRSNKTYFFVIQDGMLDADEFALAMHLMNIKLEGHDLPSELPNHLVPPSKRGFE